MIIYKYVYLHIVALHESKYFAHINSVGQLLAFLLPPFDDKLKVDSTKLLNVIIIKQQQGNANSIHIYKWVEAQKTAWANTWNRFEMGYAQKWDRKCAKWIESAKDVFCLFALLFTFGYIIINIHGGMHIIKADLTHSEQMILPGTGKHQIKLNSTLITFVFKPFDMFVWSYIRTYVRSNVQYNHDCIVFTIQFQCIYIFLSIVDSEKNRLFLVIGQGK